MACGDELAARILRSARGDGALSRRRRYVRVLVGGMLETFEGMSVEMYRSATDAFGALRAAVMRVRAGFPQGRISAYGDCR